MTQSTNHLKHSKLIKPLASNSIPEINGLILTGGKSRRMGQDKSLIDYHGVTQIDFLVDLLNPFVSKVYLSCHPNRIPETQHQVISDTFLDLGPFGGVLSAFRFDPNSAWLVVACDIPLLDEETISHLIRQRDPDKVAVCIFDPETELPEPLLTVWEPKAYPILLQFLSQGVSCLRKSLINSDSKQIHIDRPEVLRNANSPEEAVEIRKILLNRTGSA
jgi:molybdopterin-guanine dinucleotide biosynthesis protein A